MPVVAGAGGYNTAHVIEMAREFQALGANGILSVSPYYNKPTQEGLYQHYKAIAAAISLPIILYNIPGRTGVNIEPATVTRLAEIDNIVGVKEASGNISQMAAVLDMVPERFLVLSGDDAITLPLMSLGGRGLISVVVQRNSGGDDAHRAARLANDFAGAREIHRRYFPADGSELHRDESGSRESRDGADGLARAGVPAADGARRSPKIWRKSAARSNRSGWSNRSMLRAEIEQLFDENPGAVYRRAPSPVSAIQGCAECGRNSRGRAGSRRREAAGA